MQLASSARRSIREAGLALTLVMLAAIVFAGLPWLFTAMLAFHMLLRIYDGRFGGWRTASWFAFVLVQFAIVAEGFLAYVLPWGQLSFWLAARYGILVQFPPAEAVVPVLGAFSWSTFFTDVFALHTRRLRERRTWLLIAAAILALAVPLVIYDIQHLIAPTARGQVLTAPRHILPSLAISSSFAVLRAVPSKPLGIALLALLLLLPATAAWMGGRRRCAPRMRWIRFALVSGLGASWVGLTILGLLAPDPPVLWAARALVVYELIFFLVLPFVPVRGEGLQATEQTALLSGRDPTSEAPGRPVIGAPPPSA